MKKRFLSALLSFCMLLTLLPMGVAASQDDFVIDADSVLVQYTGAGRDVVIPDGVTAIGEKAFFGCETLTSAIIPDGVTTIGGNAFEDCAFLTSVVIPDGVTSVGDYAFLDCASLTSVVIPESVTSIGEAAFFNCSGLTSIDIPSGVTTVSDVMLGCCENLTNVVIPEGVTSIGGHAFCGCTALTDLVIPDSVTEIGWRAFYGCSALTSVTVLARKAVFEEDEYVTIFSDCPETLVVYGHAGSTTQVYCEEHNITFVPLNGEPEHTHTYGEAWQSSEAGHWHECECGKKSNLTAHTEDSGTVTKAPTPGETGIKTYACSVCGYAVRTQVLPKPGSILVAITNSSKYYPIVDLGATLEEVDAILDSHTVQLTLEDSQGEQYTVDMDFQLRAEDNPDYDPLTQLVQSLTAYLPLDDTIQNPDGLKLNVWVHLTTCSIFATQVTYLAPPVGTAFEDLELPKEVRIVRSRDKKYEKLPVTWSDQGYDPTQVGYQYIDGTFDTPLPIYLTNENNRYPRAILYLVPPDHTHTYHEYWQSDETNHWHMCDCLEQSDLAAHIPITDPAVAATCTTNGKTKGSHCQICGRVITAPSTIPATGHSYAEWSSDETNHWRQCIVCDDMNDQTAHTEDDGTVTKEPTQEEMGVKTFACSVCGYVMRMGSIPAIGENILGGLAWSIDAMGKLTLAGEFPDDGAIWVACWNSKGRFLSAQVLTAQRMTAQLEPDWASLKLLWLNGNFAPQCAAVVIEK